RWDWDSESFSLTALVMKLATADGDFNQLSSFFTPHDDDELYSLYFTLKTIANHELDLYWIYVNGHGSATGSGSGNSGGSLGNAVGGPFGGTAYYHTIGGRIGGVFPDIAAGLDWNLEVAYQFGDANVTGGGNADIDGLAVEAELGITFNKSSMFRLYARFLWAEGADGDDSGYVPLYPNRHSNSGFRARYGIFDLVPMTNVVTFQVGMHFDPDPAWTLGATVLWATTDEEFAGVDDDDYGWEIDVWAEYRYSEHLVFNAGLAFLFPDDSGVAIWGTDDDTQFLMYMQARLLF
ncbi:MAG TPA: alginate export family protein, partial [Planctomycetota bacterium]|nr:alginate export family protein [Planctomycetota bacterium]